MTTQSINWAGVTLASAAMLTLAACSSTDTPPPPAEAVSLSAFEEGVPGGIMVNTMDMSAKVTAIDYTTRKVTLLGPDGKKHKMKVGPEVVNLDQVKVGDMVNASVTQELVIFVGDESAYEADGSAAIVALAPKGAQPGGVMAETTQVTGTVTAIDQESRTATLKFEDGTTETFPVRDDIDLSRYKVGQKVVFGVTEIVAIGMTKSE